MGVLVVLCVAGMYHLQCDGKRATARRIVALRCDAPALGSLVHEVPAYDVARDVAEQMRALTCVACTIALDRTALSIVFVVSISILVVSIDVQCFMLYLYLSHPLAILLPPILLFWCPSLVPSISMSFSCSLHI